MTFGYEPPELFANEDAQAVELSSYAHNATWVRVRRSPWSMLLRLAVQDGGRLVCTGVVMGEPDGSVPITVRAVREAPIAQVLEEISERALSADPLEGLVYSALLDLAGDARVLATHRGPKGKDDAFYRRVWDAYTEALKVAPTAPVKYMREQGGIYGSDSTVRRWKREAERRLGPKTKGQRS
jgi:hypothetical protein